MSEEFEMQELPGMPATVLPLTEGVLVTIYRDCTTGTVAGRIISWKTPHKDLEEAFEDLGPFDLPDVLAKYEAELLHRLG